VLTVDSQSPHLEIDSYRANVVVVEGIVREAKQHGSLPGVALTNQDYLKECIEIIVWLEPLRILLYPRGNLLTLLMILNEAVLFSLDVLTIYLLSYAL
jgi:hypothetical protein